MNKLILTFSLSLICYISFGQNWVPVVTSTNAGLNGQANALDSANGLLYIGGRFDSAGGIKVNNIAAWNGSSYSALGTGLGGVTFNGVSAITEYNGNIIVGGIFDSAGGVPVNNIAMWNGSSWTALGKGITGIDSNIANGGVRSLVVYNNNLYAAGDFDSAGGLPASYIAQWNGTSWSAVGTGISYIVNTMAVYNNNLYVGGTTPGYLNVAAKLGKWNGTVWDSIKGIYMAGYTNGCAGPGVLSLATGNGLLYIAGGFTDSAKKHSNFASWNGTGLNWNISSAYFNPTNNFYGEDFNSMCVYNGFIIGGNSSVFFYNDTLWQQVGNGIKVCTMHICYCSPPDLPYTAVNTIAGYKGTVYIGGSFSQVYGNLANGFAMFSGIVGINEMQETKTITVYPNPSNGVFQLKITNYELGMKNMVEVYNMLGEKVLSQYPVLNTQYSIDLSSQPTGVYLYRITNMDGSLVSTGKLIKQ